MSLYDFITSHAEEILEQTVQHIGLTLGALVIALSIGIPLGIILTRYKKASSVVLGGIGIIQTIPSVALLGFLLPFLGIGVTPAIVALFLYALLPIVRNTHAGIIEVDPAIVESAKGMGMSRGQILRKVKLPIAAPIIFAGIRTATIINVGVATLCALIGAGGLGTFIFRGIGLNNVNMIFAGAIPAALLALFFDFVLAGIQRFIRKIIKPLLVVFAVTLIALVVLFVVPYFQQRPFTAGFTAEFMERPDGYPGLSKTYNLYLDTVDMDPGLMYSALKESKVDAIIGFSTDGRIEAYNFRVLEDDKNFFPPYYAAPLVRQETLQKYPELRDILNRLEGKISNKAMTQMNYLVDQEKQEPRQVAKNFLNDMGFSTDVNRKGNSDIIIASKNFTEQYILANMFAILIENNSTLDVELKTGLGGTKICFDALQNGQIDLYPEYTGTGLLAILNADEATQERLLGDKDKVYDYVKKETKSRFGLEWLAPLGFNNTYALMMREQQAEKLNISTISDLQNYLTKKR